MSLRSVLAKADFCSRAPTDPLGLTLSFVAGHLAPTWLATWPPRSGCREHARSLQTPLRVAAFSALGGWSEAGSRDRAVAPASLRPTAAASADSGALTTRAPCSPQVPRGGLLHALPRDAASRALLAASRPGPGDVSPRPPGLTFGAKKATPLCVTQPLTAKDTGPLPTSGRDSFLPSHPPGSCDMNSRRGSHC